MRRITLIIRLSFALVCGLILSLWIAQSNPHVQAFLGDKILHLLEEEWKVKFTVKSRYINFLTGTVFCTQGRVTPTDGKKFEWSFDECLVKVNLLPLFESKLKFWTTINNVSAWTRVSADRIDIVDYLTDMFEAEDEALKIRPQGVTINNIKGVLKCGDHDVDLEINGQFHMRKQKIAQRPEQSWLGRFELGFGNLSYQGVPLVKDFDGVLSFFNNKKSCLWDYRIKSTLALPFFDAKNRYQFNGGFLEGTGGRCLLFDRAQKTNLSIDYKDDQVKLKGRLHAQPDASLLSQKKVASVELPCEVDVLCALNSGAPKVSGTVSAVNPVFNGVALDLLEVSFDPFIEHFAGAFICNVNKHAHFAGDWSFDTVAAMLSLSVKNDSDLCFFDPDKPTPVHANWIVKRGGFAANLSIDHQARCLGAYSSSFFDAISGERITFKGAVKAHVEQADFHGTVRRNFSERPDPGTFDVSLKFEPQFFIEKILYQKRGEKLIDIHADQTSNKNLRGHFKYSLIRSFLDPTLQRTVFGGNCIFDVFLSQKSFQKIRGAVKLSSGRFYIPENRNLIDRFSTGFCFDRSDNKLIVNKLHLGFCKGSLTCPRGVIHFDYDHGLGSVHAPLLLHDLFINWKRDFYGFVYGNALLSKGKKQGFELTGNLFLKKSLLKDNIFSQDSLKTVYGPLGIFSIGPYPVNVDLKLCTEKPLSVVTSSLKTFAHLGLTFQYEHTRDFLQIPRVTGEINLEGGYLKFLRNQLMIESGKVLFLTNQMTDPLIDLIASNRINKYQITMHVTGSFQKPTIVLESTPSLSEEQIFSVLLQGSEHASLQADLPAMLMQNLHNILLGNKRGMQRSTSFFQKIARPLKYVQITPNFTDQSARGGMKGVISVDLNNQLHAQIQKNFNLQEDFEFYVQYQLTDDVSIKFIKDQRGEIGSEVEVTLKL